jgi:dolichol-phosphate mannosyltransferase
MALLPARLRRYDRSVTSSVSLVASRAAAPARRTVRIVLPAYNEAEHLPALLAALRETMDDNGIAYEVIVVDDGSRDRTGEVVEAHAGELPVVLIRHAVNQGLGATIRDGLLAALERAAARDVVVTMDADDTHMPGLIVQMVRMIGEGYDVVIASRYRAESRLYGVPLHRRAMSRAASLLLRVIFPIRGVRDFTCGYRAYRADVLRRAVDRYHDEFVNQDGFQCMVDILLKLRPMHLIFGEVPLLLRYDRKGGDSKMDIASTAANTLLLLVRRRLGY